MNAAVVPIKTLAAGKSRLHGVLERDHVEALCLAMMQDVVAALIATPSMDRVVVATPDASAADAARALGAEAFEGPDPGLNAAIESATARLANEGATLVMTVLGDVAAAEPEDFERLILETRSASSQPGGETTATVGLAPSSDGGTAALARMPAQAIAARFGADSAARHRAEAASQGVQLVELDLPSLRLDLDRPNDVEAFLAEHRRGGPRTRACLAGIGWATQRTEAKP